MRGEGMRSGHGQGVGEGIEPSNVHTLHPPPSLPSGVGRLPLLGLLLRELCSPGQLEDDRQTAHRQRGRNQGANAHQEHQWTIVVHL